MKCRNVCGRKWVCRIFQFLDFVYCVVLWKEHISETKSDSILRWKCVWRSLLIWFQYIQLFSITENQWQSGTSFYVHVGSGFHLLSWEENRLIFRNNVFFPDYWMMDRVQKTSNPKCNIPLNSCSVNPPRNKVWYIKTEMYICAEWPCLCPGWDHTHMIWVIWRY